MKENNSSETLDYHQFEKEVFGWLFAKYKADKSFTFSVRRNSKKGAERDYFIGTETGNYFGTTFWTIPIDYPGSSADLINLIFKIGKKGYSYHFEFNQTKNPDDTQNRLALQFIVQLRPLIKQSFGFSYETSDDHKMENYKTRPARQYYENLDELFEDVDKDINKLLPTIDVELEKYRKMNPGFKGYRITNQDFDQMISKMNERFRKNSESSTGAITNDEIVPRNTSNAATDTSRNHIQSLNQILYGPPGTGKTYHTINIALEILGEKIEGLGRKEIKDLFDRRMDEGRIEFVTFHQSMSYEDFIEGIKPQQPNKEGEGIVYRVEPGIFRKMAEKADKRAGNFSEVVEKFKQEISEADGKPAIIIKSPSSTFDVTYRSGTMFYIRPHNSSKEDAWYPVSIDNIKKFHDTESLEGIYNTTYVRGIHQFLVKERGLKKGRDSNENMVPYVLIIDEINRGNISQIFGELITLIEDDKRLGKKESLEVTLPYSKGFFGVPPNLYIIGTMNTADRSVEALDTALRRRFSFVEMPPQPALLEDYGRNLLFNLFKKYADKNWTGDEWETDIEPQLRAVILNPDVYEQEKEKLDAAFRKNNWDHVACANVLKGSNVQFISLKEMLTTINRRIEKLIDKDHCIGHAYFMGLETSGDPLTQLKSIFQNKILPLLQEYFYGNYGKMQLVLGKDFVHKDTNTSTADFNFAENEYQGHDDALEREVYHIVNWLQTEKNKFDNDFITAIKNIDTSRKNG